jgi:hypothetical protein
MGLSIVNITIITILFFIVFYCVTKILTFYGISSDAYSLYFLFYLFIILSIYVLPNDYSKPTNY